MFFNLKSVRTIVIGLCDIRFVIYMCVTVSVYVRMCVCVEGGGISFESHSELVSKSSKARLDRTSYGEFKSAAFSPLSLLFYASASAH